tara:strand:+ start:639 stop:812 length:174 start_codon:yes stop_codon:yes gene_type:complete
MKKIILVIGGMDIIEYLKNRCPSLQFINKNDITFLVYYLSTNAVNQITVSKTLIEGI